MSALPPFHQFRDAKPLKDQPISDELREASDLLDFIPEWDEGFTSAKSDQEVGHHKQHGHRLTDSTGMEVYSPAFRIGLAITLALASWSVVLITGHFLVKAFH